MFLGWFCLIIFFLFINIMWLEILWVKFILCVIMIIVIFFLVILWIIDSILFISLGFKVDVGLLNKMILGFKVSVLVMFICCCWFFDNWFG